MSRQFFTVSGMSCEHCVRAVTSEVQALPGVREVTIDLATGRVTVDADTPVDGAAFATAVDEAGYEVVGGPEPASGGRGAS